MYQMLGSVIGLQAALQHSPDAFVVYRLCTFALLKYQLLSSEMPMQALSLHLLYAVVVYRLIPYTCPSDHVVLFAAVLGIQL
jgi:hypothetical protein